MCKHVAAVLYGVGSRLDDSPELPFLLRGVDEAELIATDMALPHGTASADGLADGDLEDIFGIELDPSGESLAGRIAYVELTPLDILETGRERGQRLWVRGGFPPSFLAASDRRSALWREHFIATYLERDIPQLGPRIPAETLRRFWTMLAHAQGGLLNAANFARALGVDGKTIAKYLDLQVDLLLVRRLQPLHANVRKRLVKAPKVYVRDSGLVHTLLRLEDEHGLLGHPVAGMSWEGFVIEKLIRAANATRWAAASRRSASPRWRTSCRRSASGNHDCRYETHGVVAASPSSSVPAAEPVTRHSK